MLCLYTRFAFNWIFVVTSFNSLRCHIKSFVSFAISFWNCFQSCFSDKDLWHIFHIELENSLKHNSCSIFVQKIMFSCYSYLFFFFFFENLIRKYLYILFLVLMLDIKIVVRAGKKTSFWANFACCCFEGKFWNTFFKISIASNSFWSIMLKFHWDCIGKTGH